MSTTTAKLGLIKPSLTDIVSPTAFNQNFDIIDEEISELKTDYIIAQGVQGIWTYRRWASGIAECWGVRSIDFTVSGTKIYRMSSIILPIVFKSLSYKNVSVTYVSGDKLMVATSGSNDKWSLTETGETTIMADANFNGKQTGYLSYDFRGHWKE